MKTTRFFDYIFCSAILFAACKPIKNASEVKHRDGSADVSTEAFGLRINITTNTATFFEKGVPIRNWKVATARLDGKSQTPEGRFRAHELTVCVPWVSTRNSASTGPCAPDNPLGYRAIWFSGAEYGVHGVDSSHLSSVTATSAVDRRQSSGCVRNHPNDIKWLTDKVASLYGTTPEGIAQNISNKTHASFAPVAKGLAVEIGRWPVDPAIAVDPVANPDTNSTTIKTAQTNLDPNSTAPSSGISATTATCKVETATGIIRSQSSIPVFDSENKQIGDAKSLELVCPTEQTKDNRTLVFFLSEPSGFAWVNNSDLATNCTGNEKWPSLSNCLKYGGGRGCLVMCKNTP